MEIQSFNPEMLDKNTFSAIIEKSFEGSQDAVLENWFSYEEMLKNLQMGRSACFFAVENNKISALVYAQTESPINGKEGTEKWILNLLAVLPECQGRGIGKKLVTKVEEIAKKKGAKKIFVTTNELDRPVQLFYERLGYKFAGRVQDYQYGLNNSALFFLKQL